MSNIYHPEYNQVLNRWNVLYDCYLGEREIKLNGDKYLPKTASMIEDWNIPCGNDHLGRIAYKNYLKRAEYPDFLKNTIKEMIGIIHSKALTIELPKKMEGLILNCNNNEDSIQTFLRKINEYQLLFGRCGILVDISDDNDMPYLSLYQPLSIVNWNSDNTFLILKENSYKIKESSFEWEPYVNYKLCLMDSNRYFVQNFEFENDTSNPDLKFEEELAISPSIKGKFFEELPFIFVNTVDTSCKVSDIPLSSLSDIALSVYRLQADYKQALFMENQSTLVVSGNNLFREQENKNDTMRVGVGQVLEIGQNDKAYYISPPGTGIEKSRIAIQDKYQEANEFRVKFLENSKESGEALKVRLSSKIASLITIANTSVNGIEKALKQCARVLNLNPEEVKISIDLDLIKSNSDVALAIELFKFKSLGLPISNKSLHNIFKSNDITNFTYEEELEYIEEEIGLSDTEDIEDIEDTEDTEDTEDIEDKA